MITAPFASGKNGHPEFQRSITRFLAREKTAMQAYFAELEARSPFKIR
jgi:predicted N-acyltransferase